MSKGSGGTKPVKPSQNTSAENKSLFARRMRMGVYDSDYSFVSDKSGAFVLFMKGHIYHEDEMECARHLADNGISVELRPEGIEVWSTARGANNEPKYAEGVLSSFYLFDQRTIGENTTNIVSNIKRGIEHAKEKNARIAVIYDKYGKAHRNDIEDGMKKFEQFSSNVGKIDGVIVVDKNGNVYQHYYKR